MAISYNPANDPYATFAPGPSSPGQNAVSVAPSDTVDFTSYPKSLVVTAAGNVVALPMKAADDGAHLVTLTGMAIGYVLPFRARRIMATGTTASLVAITD